MATKDWSDVVKEKVKKYSKEQIIFTKSRIIDWLCKRNNSTIEDLKREVLDSTDLTFTERQEVEYEGETEERFRCYYVYSKTRGRCYVLKLDYKIEIITVFPLGRTTLKRYRKRFK